MENWISLPDPMGAKGFWIALISGLSANGVLQVAYLIYVQRTRFSVHSESGKSSQVTSPKKVTTPT
jgi:Na+-driven multidrug efflux pump